MNTHVCVIGSFNVDVVSMVARFPVPGESLIAASSQIGAGGKGYNQAIAAACSGAKVHFITKIGQDDFGIFAEKKLSHGPIQHVTLLRSKQFKTGNALIYVSAQDAENMICVDPGANMSLNTADLERCRTHLESARLLLIQLENNLDALQAIIKMAHAAAVPIILNPAPYQKLPEDLLANIWLCTPNQVEVELMTGIAVNSGDTLIQDATKAADKLHQRGVANVVITLGANGAFVSTAAGRYLIPAYPCKLVDTTGAGDAFNGALVAQLAQGMDLRHSLLFAACYASLVVEQAGATAALVTETDCIARMLQHRNITEIPVA